METEGFRIERATALDIGTMLDFWRATPGLGVGRGDDEESLRAFFQRNPSTCLIIRENGRLIGTVLGGFDGRRGYIYHLAVHPDNRGRGYGKALLSFVLCELKSLGARKIHLFAFGNNQQALAFYRSQGWEERRDIQVFSWDSR